MLANSLKEVLYFISYQTTFFLPVQGICDLHLGEEHEWKKQIDSKWGVGLPLGNEVHQISAKVNKPFTQFVHHVCVSKILGA